FACYGESDLLSLPVMQLHLAILLHPPAHQMKSLKIFSYVYTATSLNAWSNVFSTSLLASVITESPCLLSTQLAYSIPATMVIPHPVLSRSSSSANFLPVSRPGVLSVP